MEEIITRKNIYIDLAELIDQKNSCVIATVVETDGSTPQKPGSSAIFAARGLIQGTVGGGQVEHAIMEEAADLLNVKRSGYYQFNLNDDISDPDPVVCGGEMAVIIDAFPEKHILTFEKLIESYSLRKSGVLITFAVPDHEGGFSLVRYWYSKDNRNELRDTITREASEMAEILLKRNIPGDFNKILIENPDSNKDTLVFFESIVPLPQLIIAGAGHIGKALSHLANLLDFDVTVWDDREEYANKKNLPDAGRVVSGNIENTLAKIKVEKDTFIVIVTRGHRLDSEVLRQFITSPVGYIGLIGSKKKVAQTRELFIEKGWATETQWERIHAPIGLEINSKSVQEIAVSIAAQLVKIRYELSQ